MKKIKILLSFLFFLLLLPFNSCKKSNTLVVAEVTHSLFYAPMYVALEKGYFKDEGLDVTFITTPGADKVMSSLLSKDATIGLMGLEANCYVYLNGQKDYATSFARLTRTDGSFLLGRERIDNFTFDMLKGKTIIGGRKGGMPEMVLEYILKNKGLTITQNGKDSTKDVNIRTDVSFDVMTGVFVNGESDFVTAFEPNGTTLEKANKGYIITSLSEGLNKDIPYTCFSCLKSNLEIKKDEIIKFKRSIKKGLDFVNNNIPKDISPYLINSFPSNTINEIESVISNYQRINAWPSDITIPKSSFDTLIDIIKLAGELDKSIVVPYSKIVSI